jgi:hypothetical protein
MLRARAAESKRARELEEARLVAETASRAKEGFLKLVSLELKTPLAAALAWVRILRSKELPEAERIRAVEAIEHSVSVVSRGEIAQKQVDYEVTPEDVVAFQRHFLRTSPLARRNRRRAFTSGVVFASIPALMIAALGNWKVALGAEAIAGAVYLAAYFVVNWFNRRFGFRKQRNLAGIGKQTLIISSEGLVERSATVEIRRNWGRVERTEMTSGYLLIWLNAQSAHVVPLKAFPSLEEARLFEGQIRDLKASASQASLAQ